MADLKALFNGKKDTQREETEEAPGESAATDGQQEAAAEPEAESAPAAKPKLAFLKGAARIKPSPSSDGQSGEAVEGGTPELPTSLDDLANSTVEGKAPPQERVGPSFDDELPATAPLRDLPEDLEESQKQFVELMDSAYQVMHEPDLLGNVIRSIMIELKNQPQYIKLVSDSDIRTFIRGMRNTMGLAKIQKAEKKAKTGGRSRSKAVDQDMLGDLESLGLSLGGE